MLKIITTIYHKIIFKKAIKVIHAQAEAFIICDSENLGECEIKLQKYLKYCEVIWAFQEKEKFMLTYDDMDDQWLNDNISKLIKMVQAYAN